MNSLRSSSLSLRGPEALCSVGDEQSTAFSSSFMSFVDGFCVPDGAVRTIENLSTDNVVLLPAVRRRMLFRFHCQKMTHANQQLAPLLADMYMMHANQQLAPLLADMYMMLLFNSKLLLLADITKYNEYG